MSTKTRTQRFVGSTSRSNGTDSAPLDKRVVAVVAVGALLLGVLVGGGLIQVFGSRSQADATKTVAPAPASVVPSKISAGPTRFDGFVPVGYQRSEAGAIAAASSYTAMVTELIQRTELEVRASARRAATPEAADAVEEGFLRPVASIRAALAVAGEKNPRGRALLRTVPIGTKLVSYADNTARVDVWAMGMVGLELESGSTSAGDQAPQAVFTVTSYQLAWVNGDWHIADFRYAEGVGPALTRTRVPSPTELINSAATFAPFRYQAAQGGK